MTNTPKKGYEQFLKTGNSGEIEVTHTSRTGEQKKVIVELTATDVDEEMRKIIWVEQMANFSL